MDVDRERKTGVYCIVEVGDSVYRDVTVRWCGVPCGVGCGVRM